MPVDVRWRFDKTACVVDMLLESSVEIQSACLFPSQSTAFLWIEIMLLSSLINSPYELMLDLACMSIPLVVSKCCSVVFGSYSQ